MEGLWVLCVLQKKGSSPIFVDSVSGRSGRKNGLHYSCLKESQKQLLATRKVFLSTWVKHLWIYCLELYRTWYFGPKEEYFSEKIGSFTQNVAGVCYTTDRANHFASSAVKTGPIMKWQMSTRCFRSPMLVVIREQESFAVHKTLIKWNLFLKHIIFGWLASFLEIIFSRE